MTTTPRCDFSTIRRMALEWLSVYDFIKFRRPETSAQACRSQRAGESNVEAIERSRREQARIDKDYCRALEQFHAAEKCVREATDIDGLRRALLKYTNSENDDLAHTCQKLIKHIDRRC